MLNKHRVDESECAFKRRRQIAVLNTPGVHCGDDAPVHLDRYIGIGSSPKRVEGHNMRRLRQVQQNNVALENVMRTVVEYVSIQSAVRIDETKALSILEVLSNQRLQELALSGTRRSDDVHVSAPLQWRQRRLWHPLRLNPGQEAS